MKDLERTFDQAMHNVYVRAKNEAGYNASIFLNMLFDKGGLATAKQLINNPQVSDGYTALWERGRLDITVEAIVVENSEFHPLFTEDEIIRAKKRLEKYNYRPQSDAKR